MRYPLPQETYRFPIALPRFFLHSCFAELEVSLFEIPFYHNIIPLSSKQSVKD